MNIKIQGGGGGKYANSGSCFGTVSYLRHEDAERQEQGQQVEAFFNHDKDNVKSKEVTNTIDSNKAKLCKSDAKFFVITVSPSKEELKSMGNTPQERVTAFRDYIRNDVMQNYAKGFNKGLESKDIVYFAKIHHERKAGKENDMHAHIIVSRKDITNTKKISPMTNHKGEKNAGTAQGGFNRTEFYKTAEQSFDRKFTHERDYKESFEYLNAMKNGTLEDKKEAVEKAVHLERNKEIQQQLLIREKQEQKQEQEQRQEEKQEQRQEQQQERKRGLSR